MHQISSRTAAESFWPELFAYCPTMDLVATVSKRDSVDVWRLNGQRVFGASFAKDKNENEKDDENHEAENSQVGQGIGRGEAEMNVKAVGWKRDGQILAVACSDGTISLINAFTGKVAHRLSAYTHQSPTSTSKSSSQQSQSQPRIRSSKPSKPQNISTLSWTTHFAYPTTTTVRSHLFDPETSVSLDQILSLRADVGKLLKLKADLPGELSNIDIETSLPKLATLPPTGVGVDDDVFSSRGSVDVIFHGGGNTSSGSGGAGGVDALIVGVTGERCEVHLRIFDSFEVGSVDVTSVLPMRKDAGIARVVRMESHPFLSTLFLVVQTSSDKERGGEPSLHLLSLDMSFIPQTGRNLPLVARKATQLGNLLRYISQVQRQLVAEVKAAFDLPSRFLGNINESLAESDESADFTFAAHHLAVTGDCDPKLKEWLVDEVGDRGLKRWEKAVGDCLEVVRRMTSECILPALERCLVVLSRLDGMARFQPTSSRLGLDEKSITKLRETVDAMAILAEDLLLDVGLEMREFACFMKWIKWECEVEALEEGSERAEELRESWTGENELRLVLGYVDGAMKESRLKRYLVKDDAVQMGATTASFDEDPDVGFYAEYTKRRASSNKDKRMPTLGDMGERLQKQSDTVFAQIAETFRKSILATYMFEMPTDCDEKNLDLRAIPDSKDSNMFRLLAISGDKQHAGHLQYTVVALQQGASSKHTTQPNRLAIPDVKTILDAKFVDDTSFFVLAETSSDIRIYSYDTNGSAGQGALEIKRVFEQGQTESGMKPARLDVNGRVGRRAVAVLDRDGMGYAVFDLDADDETGQTDMGGDSFMS